MKKILNFFFNNFFNIASFVGALATLYQVHIGNFSFALFLVFITICSIIKSIFDYIKQNTPDNQHDSKSILVDGEADEMLTLAEGNRTTTDSLEINSAKHIFLMDGMDLTATFIYKGKCISKTGSEGMVFSISGYSIVPLKDLKCIGFDLAHDPRKRFPIQPILKSSDGLCKKILIPFPRRLKNRDSFYIEMSYTWPNSLRHGVNHIDSSLSFSRKHLNEYIIRLIFVKNNPKWIRVFTPIKGLRSTKYEKTLPLTTNTGNKYSYIDIVDSPSAKSVRIYQFIL